MKEVLYEIIECEIDFAYTTSSASARCVTMSVDVIPIDIPFIFIVHGSGNSVKFEYVRFNEYGYVG